MPLSSFASPNTNSQNIVLEFSIAYFVVDLLHYAVFFPSDILFICHHLATLYVFMTCRFVVRHGASALLVLLVLAEITSACQNVWTLAGFRKADTPAASKLYEFLSPRFYALYTICRVILGPLFVLKMGIFFLSGTANNVIPSWAWVSWMVVITTAIFVSISWVLNHWIEWFRERSRVQKKVIQALFICYFGLWVPKPFIITGHIEGFSVIKESCRSNISINTQLQLQIIAGHIIIHIMIVTLLFSF